MTSYNSRSFSSQAKYLQNKRELSPDTTKNTNSSSHSRNIHRPSIDLLEAENLKEEMLAAENNRHVCPYPANIIPKDLPHCPHDIRFPSKLPYSEKFIAQGTSFFYTTLRVVTNYGIAVEENREKAAQMQAARRPSTFMSKPEKAAAKRSSFKRKTEKQRQRDLAKDEKASYPDVECGQKKSFLSKAFSAVTSKKI